MRHPLLAASLLAGLLTGCASVEPDATLVKVTEKSGDVAGCKPLGIVVSSRPVVSPEDSRIKQMQTKAARLGGNVLFVPSYTYNVTGTGTAYLCESRTTR